MGYDVPKTQEQIFALDIIPSDLLQRAQQVHQRKEVPDFKVQLPTDNDEEDDDDQQDMSEKDSELVAKFLATRTSAIYIVRNLHIVNVPIADMADAAFNKNYVYVQIYTADKVDMQIQIIADPD